MDIYLDHEKNESNSKIAIVALLISFCSGLGLWFYKAPVENNTLTFWVGAVLIGLPSWAGLESFGSLVFSAQWVNKISKTLRILIGVIWALIGLSITGVLVIALSTLMQ
ncbi:hypothetical protein [Thioalbus denitrificans]|uniref:hypothetical protein n=1 Tax=Thioalbus denitrificans TaxID=547122 RepID=UPI0011C02002|nr:hypothetical protein [Thioalbus denitrificans]